MQGRLCNMAALASEAELKKQVEVLAQVAPVLLFCVLQHSVPQRAAQAAAGQEALCSEDCRDACGDCQAAAAAASRRRTRATAAGGARSGAVVQSWYSQAATSTTGWQRRGQVPTADQARTRAAADHGHRHGELGRQHGHAGHAAGLAVSRAWTFSAAFRKR